MGKAFGNKMAMHLIDLTKIDGEGSFPCPNCGAIISPEDETEEVYRIIDAKTEGDELAEIVIKCKRCGSIIRLTGFLQKPTLES